MLSAETEKRIAITVEMIGGRKISEVALEALLNALDGFGDHAVCKALDRCLRECRGWLSPSDIIQRIDDGRPGEDEAWALCPRSESDSTVWTEEIAQAFEAVRLMPDPVAARMSFIDAYKRIVTDARGSASPVRWTPSLGHDPNGRERALRAAVVAGRLSSDRAELLLPGFSESTIPQLPAASGPVDVKSIIKSMELQYHGEEKP